MNSTFVEGPVGSLVVTRRYALNMPQMALGGLAESWLFKELGDIHWTMITKMLGAPSSQLLDANGDRLYATFTRLRIMSSHALVHFVENEELSAEGRITRFGTGVYFGELMFESGAKTIEANVMSTFTKRSQSASNKSLLKGQPVALASRDVPVLDKLPAFAEQYRQRRLAALSEPIFQTTYDLIPFYDINGVGLLYFAAFPLINDICELRFIDKGNEWAIKSSTKKRDIFYFGNCDITDQLIYRVHTCSEKACSVVIESSLSRASDKTLVAYIVTEKSLLD